MIGRSRPRTTAFAACAAVLFALSAGAARAQSSRTYVDILKQLTDLDRLTHLQTGKTAGLFSSWDRNGKTVWGANGDAGQYLRVEPDGEAVMMDIDGPGCIYRTWSANPMGKIRIYLDGATTPSYEWGFPDLFDGNTYPFIRPLVYRRDAAQSASDCYVPIPFAKHIKITADRAHGEYYQFNYLLFPKDTTVSSFKLPLSSDERSALLDAADAWGHPGVDPKPALPDQAAIKKEFKIGPGRTVRIADLQGPGIVRAIRASVSSKQRYAWRKLLLRATWDGAKWPQVLSPLGTLFGFDWYTPEYGSLIAGCQDGKGYLYYPMPFRKSGKIEVVNTLEQPADVTIEVEYAPVPELAPDTCYFYARWRHEPGSMTFDYPFLMTAGQGHFVGVAMPIDHPLGGWWGEGDDKVWVDDDDFPNWIGTGSEDYFGDAWGIRYLPGPSWGCAYDKDNRTCNYRWHFMDLVPFTKRFGMTIENYGPNGGGPRGQYEYNSTAFWYQKELVPPFQQLKGQTFTGGDDPSGPPKKMEYDPAIFVDLKRDDVRTYGKAAIFTQEAEDLFAAAVKAHKAKIVDDAKLPYEYNHERAVDFGKAKAGQHLADMTLKADTGIVYYPRILTAPDDKVARATIELEGKQAAVKPGAAKGVLELDGIYMTAGEHKVGLVAVTEGRAIVDAIQLEPAPRVADAIEAEDMPIARMTSGAPQAQPSTASRGASAGRFLDLAAERDGQGMVLRIEKRPQKPYVLGVRPMLGPKSGIVQAFAGDTPIGPRFDLYAETDRPGDAVLPLGPMPDGNEVEIRAVGKNEKSQGYRVGLDYFRWEPQIVGPGSAEGVWARVLATRGCEYRIQDMSPDFSGGHQLWIQPSDRGATVDIGITVPREADYAIEIRYATSWDYAIFQAAVDGTPLGDPMDGWSETVKLADQKPLGTVHLTAGMHVLQLRAVDKNPASKGYLMGIDHIVVK